MDISAQKIFCPHLPKELVANLLELDYKEWLIS
jgi:hypothetical protein